MSGHDSKGGAPPYSSLRVAACQRINIALALIVPSTFIHAKEIQNAMTYRMTGWRGFSLSSLFYHLGILEDHRRYTVALRKGSRFMSELHV